MPQKPKPQKKRRPQLQTQENTEEKEETPIWGEYAIGPWPRATLSRTQIPEATSQVQKKQWQGKTLTKAREVKAQERWKTHPRRGSGPPATARQGQGREGENLTAILGLIRRTEPLQPLGPNTWSSAPEQTGKTTTAEHHHEARSSTNFNLPPETPSSSNLHREGHKATANPEHRRRISGEIQTTAKQI